MTTRASLSEGFTLVELLVSLALMSLMAVYALMSFRTMSDMQRAGKRIEVQNEVAAVARFLESDLSIARKAFGSQIAGQSRLLFEGTDSSLTYVVSSNDGRDVGGLYLVKLSLDPNGVLTLTRRLARLGSATPDTMPLLRGVRKLTMSYLDPQKNNEITFEWKNMDHLPYSVKVKVEFEPDDSREWPLVVAYTRHGL